MKILTKLKYKTVSYKINKLLKEQKRKVVQTSLADAQNIGIIFNKADNNEIENILKGFEKKNIFLLGLCQNKNHSEENNYITVKDFSLNCRLKTQTLNNFVVQKFDILLNLDLQNNILLQYLTLISQAKFKVGIYNDLNSKILDLMLFDTPNNISISNLIKQIYIYTNQLIKK